MADKLNCHLERSAEDFALTCHPERSTAGAKSKDLRFLKRAINYACIVFLCAACAHAQTTPNAEQTETGQKQTPHGLRNYKIRLLPVASFPSLPPAIATQLNDQHCLIPQTFEARRPENVIHGEFARKGSSDWAVLCSTDGSTSLLVFFQGQPDKPVTLATLKDTERLASEKPADDLGSAWGINTIPPEGMRHTPNVHQHGPFDHDGIEDDFVEHASTVRYYRNGTWLAVETMN